MVTAAQELHSIGNLAQMFQAMPARITAAAARIGEQPPVKLDGIAYYTAEQVERIRGVLVGQAPPPPPRRKVDASPLPTA